MTANAGNDSRNRGQASRSGLILSHQIEEIASRLERVSERNGQYMARCPAHDDRSPSLSFRIAEDGSKILMHCFGGCDTADVMAAIGMSLSDLDRPLTRQEKREWARRKQAEEREDQRINDRLAVEAAKAMLSSGRELAMDELKTVQEALGRSYE